jgi:hypothetical protein
LFSIFSRKDIIFFKNLLSLQIFFQKKVKKRSKKGALPPDFLKQQKKSLVRKYRKTILFNEKEIFAIEQYCSRFNIKSKSAFFREAIISHILNQMDDNYPKLF